MLKLVNCISKLKKHPFLREIYFILIRLLKSNNISRKMGERNKIIKKKALLLSCKILFKGSDNVITIAHNARIENYCIKIYGNNNKILIGENCQMKGGEFWIEDDGNEIIIGARTTIQANTQLAAIEGCKIVIGEDCMFSSSIVIRTGDSHSIVDANSQRINKSADVHIGAHCWVGHRAMIMKGTSIPFNTIIGLGAIVNKQFEQENTIIAGIPARVIKENVNWMRERL